MLALIATALACDCMSDARWDIPQAAYGFQGRFAGYRDDLPRGPNGQRPIEVSVRHVWTGDVPASVTLWFPWGSMSAPVLVPGDEIAVAVETLPAVLSCNVWTVGVGEVPDGLGPPMRSYTLPPGPHERFREALATCDAEGLRAGRASRVREDLSPLAHCPPEAIVPFVSDGHTPDWLVRDAPLATVLAIAAERPDLVDGIVAGALGWGRGDILGALVDRVAEPAEVLYIGNAGTEVATLRIVLARAESTDEERSRKLGQSFEPAVDGPHEPTFPRDQRHEAARFLVGQGVEVWPATVAVAIHDAYPDDDVLALVAAVAPSQRADARSQALEAAAESGRLDLFATLWEARPAEPAVRTILAGACRNGPDTRDAVLRITGWERKLAAPIRDCLSY